MRISESRIKQIIREETRRALREAPDGKGMSLIIKPGYKLPAGFKRGDRLPFDMFDEPGARSSDDRDRFTSSDDRNRFTSSDNDDSDDDHSGEDSSGGFYGGSGGGDNDDPDAAEWYDEEDSSGSGGDEDITDDYDDHGGDDDSGDNDDIDSDGDEFSDGDGGSAPGRNFREQKQASFRRIVKEETLRFLRNKNR